MRYLGLIILLLGVVPMAESRDDTYQVVVAEPFIELHTGPGRGYPVFFVIDRGEQLAVLKRRTDWYKVRSEGGVEGWASAAEMSRTVEPNGLPTQIHDPGRDEYEGRRREVGIQLGDFDGANIISVYGSWLFTRNLSVELRGSQITGDFSNGWMVDADIVHQPFPEWRVSPFFALGTGILSVDPKATLVATEDRTDQTAHVGVGLRAHLSRRFLLRAEYKSYVVFTSRDENEDVREWKAGFSFFF